MGQSHPPELQVLCVLQLRDCGYWSCSCLPELPAEEPSQPDHVGSAVPGAVAALPAKLPGLDFMIPSTAKQLRKSIASLFQAASWLEVLCQESQSHYMLAVPLQAPHAPIPTLPMCPLSWPRPSQPVGVPAWSL